jgi:hypothetical protein
MDAGRPDPGQVAAVIQRAGRSGLHPALRREETSQKPQARS